MKWTVDDIELLCREYRRRTIAELEAIFPKFTRIQITYKATSLKLHKDEDTLARIHELSRNVNKMTKEEYEAHVKEIKKHEKERFDRWLEKEGNRDKMREYMRIYHKTYKRKRYGTERIAKQRRG